MARLPVAYRLPLARLPSSAQWVILVAISLVTTGVLLWARLPAAFMLGPMLAGMFAVNGGATLRVSHWLMNVAQAIVGCLIARSFTWAIVVEFGKEWPLFLGVVVAIVIASAALGWAISKMRILQGTTAVWGLLPGAAPVMILMAEAFGADAELVAFMQYMRVVFVAITASIVARFWAHAPVGAVSTTWLPPVAWLSFAGTLSIIGVSLLAVLLPGIPAGVLIAAMFIGGVLHIGGYSTLELPPWFLHIGYALIGWNIGLKFTSAVVAAALRALPQTVSSIVAMILFCGALAAALVHVLGIDPLTAYLATSPGGADSVAIIAASTAVDTSFVMSLQTVRFLLILMVGPALSRFVAGLVIPPSARRKTSRPH